MQEITGSDTATDRRVALNAECIAVPFLDGHIPAVVVDGRPRVVIKPVVERLGLNWASQYTKLSAARWGRVVLVTTQLPGDTQSRGLATISLKAFSLWLAGIQEGRVAEHARADVIRYQDEAGDRLEEYFFGNLGAAARLSPAPLALNLDLSSLDEGTMAYLAQVGQALTQTSQALIAQKAVTVRQAKELEAAQHKAEVAESKAEYVNNFVDPNAANTLFRTFCGQINAPERKLREHLRAKGIIYKKLAGREWSKSEKRWKDVHEWNAHASYKTWFHQADQPDAPRLHNNQMRTTLYVTPIGKVAIDRWLKRNPIEGAK
ncbi:phage antirepressor N-terminal domain-containing protein [Streptomyces sp.]|uniref:phage antirepressor N-terminal domain-containing protein n=1 Tax=Streptomyces sp. TaxID=1931 RepID=UPI002F93494E